VQQQRAAERERDQQRQRRVDAVHPRERQDEHDDPRHRRQGGLDEDRREHRRRVRDAGRLAQRDRARGGRPDASRDVLRQHAHHLGLERHAIADADAPGGEQADPAEDEHEVVDGHDRERDQEPREARVRDPVAGLRPFAAHRPGAERDHDRQHEQLHRLADARMRAQVAQCRAPRLEQVGRRVHTASVWIRSASGA